jgi:hypothetical protein
MCVRKLTISIVVIYLLCWPAAVWAQDPLPTNTPAAEELPEAPAQVDVQPVAQDNQIDERLTGILRATEWFVAPRVAVRDRNKLKALVNDRPAMAQRRSR